MHTLRTSLVKFLRQDGIATIMGPLVRLIAEGEPVPLSRLAGETGLGVDQLESWLRAQPGTDWDEQGRLLGFGLTLRPTAHRFVVDGRALFTFCAPDTLLFPPILGQAASVESACPATGQPIRVEVAPHAVTSVNPPAAVVSQVNLGGVDTADIRASTCAHGHFFVSDDAAESWVSKHPGGEVRPVSEYFTLGLAAGRDVGWVARA